MKIGINASFLRKPETGIGQVTTHFLCTLIETYRMNRIFAEHTFVLYVEEDINWELPENFEKRVVLPFWKRDDLMRKWFWESRVLPREAKKDGCEKFLSLYQSATVFRNCRIEHTMLVHDIIPKLFPEYLSNARKRLYQKAIERGIVLSDKILAVSRCTEKDLVNHLYIPAQKIEIASISADPIFKKPVSYTKNRQTMQKYALESGYIYYGGGLEARKNVHNLLLAYRSLLKNRSRFSDQKTVIPNLVISGALFPQLVPLVTDIAKEVSAMNLRNYVHILGRVDQEDLPALYANAKLFIFPSKYEGFGLPVLEALSMGTPVITGKRSSLPEVAGDAAVYCDPEDPNDMAQTILTVLGRKDLRDALVQRGHERAKRYSWKGFTEKIMGSVQNSH